MSIRTTAKALILRDGCILLHRCLDEKSGILYHELPGGGQHTGEPLEEALKREVLEETGLTIANPRLAALAEEIMDDEDLIARFPDYFHRLFCIFLADLADVPALPPTEADQDQVETLWVPLEEADKLPFRPRALEGKVSQIVQGIPVYLGCSRLSLRSPSGPV